MAYITVDITVIDGTQTTKIVVKERYLRDGWSARFFGSKLKKQIIRAVK